ncbi:MULTISPECIES: hypothetical protein [Paenibacillus]|uniref:hypothetical protein n=1 Tax=Paenibacillus TaxID=44249 RepID=UPI001575E6A9|nr:hypothetical protein [Paenibacillus sp. JMULE4]NTZ20200.1 hypothetical protein [Paenibacillus sp. JMULE4]
MNTQFLIGFALLMLLHIFLDIKHWAQQPNDVKRLYILLYAVALGLFVSITLGYKPPMPTHYVVEKVSPWIFSIIHPQ